MPLLTRKVHSFRSNDRIRRTLHVIGVGSGVAGAALAAPIFCLVAVMGPHFFFRYASILFYNPLAAPISKCFRRPCMFLNINNTDKTSFVNELLADIVFIFCMHKLETVTLCSNKLQCTTCLRCVWPRVQMPCKSRDFKLSNVFLYLKYFF